MGFWEVCCCSTSSTVLGPRWIAAAGHNGPSSISLWVLAAVFFFVPGALVINELSSDSRKKAGCTSGLCAFGDFHGFVAGWTYWIYTVFYFPGLLLAGRFDERLRHRRKRRWTLSQDRTFLIVVSLALLVVAVLNIIGLNIGKWLQNAGGVGTYLPLLMLAGVAVLLYFKRGSVTPSPAGEICPRGTGIR